MMPASTTDDINDNSQA